MHKCLNISISTGLRSFSCEIAPQMVIIFYVFPSTFHLLGNLSLPLPHDHDFIIILTLITHNSQSPVQFFKGQSVRDLLFWP